MAEHSCCCSVASRRACSERTGPSRVLPHTISHVGPSGGTTARQMSRGGVIDMAHVCHVVPIIM